MARYYLIANVSDTFFQATVIHNNSQAQKYLIPFRITCADLFREFLSGYQSPLPRSLLVLVSCHHEVPLHHPKNIHCQIYIPIYIFRIYLQSGETGESPDICWKLIILEISLYGYCGQNRDPISKRA